MLTENDKKELDNKLEEFFCNPCYKTDKYRQLYLTNNHDVKVPLKQISQYILYGRIKFSPLYNSLRELYYCLGLNPETGKSLKTRRDFGPANQAAVLLSGIICELLANIKYKKINSSRGATTHERESFNENYIRVSHDGAVGIRLLRNAVAHSNYGLMVPINNHNPYKSKVFFILHPTCPVIIDKAKVERGYKSVNFVVNPNNLLRAITKACTNMKMELHKETDPAWSRWFLAEVRRKHWINY